MTMTRLIMDQIQAQVLTITVVTVAVAVIQIQTPAAITPAVVQVSEH